MNEDGTSISGTEISAVASDPADVEAMAHVPTSADVSRPEVLPPPGAAPLVGWLPEEDEPGRPRRAAVGWSLVAISIGAVVMIGSVVLQAGTQQDAKPVPAPIVADHDTHLVDRVQYDAHAVPVRFLLQTRGAPLVTEVSTNQQCATARLAQGNRTSPWVGISSQASEQFESLQLVPFQPAYLEVSIDPSAHGRNSEVALKHTVQVKTADGQVLSFDVSTGGK